MISPKQKYKGEKHSYESFAGSARKISNCSATILRPNVFKCPPSSVYSGMRVK